MKLTRNQQDVLTLFESRLIVNNDFISPTKVAHKIKGEKYHSAWASPICLSLTRMGYLERNNKGHYRINPKLIKKV